MRIMFFIPSMQAGGAERVMSVLANELIQRKVEVIIVMICNTKCEYPLSPEIKTICLSCDNDVHLVNIKRIFLRYRKIKESIREHQPDVVISFMSNTNIDVCLSMIGVHIPVIVSERNDPAVDPSNKVRRLLRKVAYTRANGFVFQTSNARNYFGRRIRTKSTIILNPLTKIPEIYKGTRTEKIVAVGRLEAQKNYPLLINAFKMFLKHYPTFQLEIYGEGREREQLENIIKVSEVQNSVKLCGYSSDVHEKIKDARCYVMCSDFEGMPNALMEAMALGLPCISTDCPCGGPKMMIDDHENGILIPVKNEKALCDAMCFMVAESEASERMGRNAARIKEKTNVSCITDQWMAYINKVINSNY